MSISTQSTKFIIVLIMLFSIIHVSQAQTASYISYQAFAAAIPANTTATGNIANNTGGRVTIETVTPQTFSNSGSAVTTPGYFWVGEILYRKSGFLQVGYSISENLNGSYNTRWFYADVPSNETGSGPSFVACYTNCNVVFGPNDSVGQNGTFNTYAFQYNKSTGNWDIYLNGNVIGKINIGSTVGSLSMQADAEVWSNNPNFSLKPVVFSNFSIYENKSYVPVTGAEAFKLYCTGFPHTNNVTCNPSNPLAIKEIGNRSNYFEVGTGFNGVIPEIYLWQPYSNATDAIWTVTTTIQSTSIMGTTTPATSAPTTVAATTKTQNTTASTSSVTTTISQTSSSQPNILQQIWNAISNFFSHL